MKNEQNARILHDICPKNTFSQILRAIPGSKADSERTRHTHRFTDAIVLNKPFMRIRMLLYSIA